MLYTLHTLVSLLKENVITLAYSRCSNNVRLEKQHKVFNKKLLEARGMDLSCKQKYKLEKHQIYHYVKQKRSKWEENRD